MRGRFGDLITAMVTPFGKDRGVEFDAAKKLATHLVEQGSEGIVVAGSTGEGPTLSDEEKIRLFAEIKEAVGGKASVIANTGTYSTDHSIHLSKQAEKAGVDALLVVTPYYNRPPQDGLLAHFRAVAQSVSIPVLLYDIPIRTGRKIEHATLVELSNIDNIVGVKDAAADVQGTARLVAQTPDTFQVYSGNDADTLPFLSVGAVGVIAVASHVVGPRMAEMISAYKAGNIETATKIHLDLMPVFDVCGITSNPIPIKAALNLLGHEVGDARLPLIPATKDQIEEIRGVLSRAGIG